MYRSQSCTDQAARLASTTALSDRLKEACNSTQEKCPISDKTETHFGRRAGGFHVNMYRSNNA